VITLISNRKQITYTDLVTHLKKCVHPNVKRIILREKDLGIDQIEKKISVIKRSDRLSEIPLLLNGPYPLYDCYGADGRHYTMEQFSALDEKPDFPFGVSVHSLEEIAELNTYDIEYLLYGHIFTTACKAGLLERGLDNLRLIVEASSNKVVSLGGINASNYKKLYGKGSDEFAMMSSVMQSESPWDYLNQFEVNR